ncbi:MAG: transposase [Myxococcota bacterium]
MAAPHPVELRERVVKARGAGQTIAEVAVRFQVGTASVKRWCRVFPSVLVLPPYSPELNPIEHTWSTLKARLRTFGAGAWDEFVRLTNEVWDEMPAAFFLRTRKRLRERHHPLPQSHLRQGPLGQVGRHTRHPPPVTPWAHPRRLARRPHHPVHPARLAPQRGDIDYRWSSDGGAMLDHRRPFVRARVPAPVQAAVDA